MTLRTIAAALLLAAPAHASAQPGRDVALTSVVMVERTVTVEGRTKTVLEPPRTVTPGDRLRFTLTYRNGGARPAADFVAVNPIPASVAYAGEASPGASVSVDGGRGWGALAALTMPAEDGKRRPARAEDVTHVRWKLSQPIPAGGGGTFGFRGVVK